VGIGDDLRNSHYLIFVDEVAADLFLKGLHAAELDVRIIPEFCQIIALGIETSTRLRSSGMQVQLLDTAAEGEGILLMRLPKSLLERRVVFIESTEGKRDLQRELRVRGGLVTSVPVYERTVVDAEADRLAFELKSAGVDLLLVHSEEVARLLVEAWGVAKMQNLLDGNLVASCNADATAFLEGAGMKLTTSASSLNRLIGRLELQAMPTREATPAPSHAVSSQSPRPTISRASITPPPRESRAAVTPKPAPSKTPAPKSAKPTKSAEESEW
jgi:uroporphyrinogen-III synthase